jgi:hypothetical protein
MCRTISILFYIIDSSETEHHPKRGQVRQFKVQQFDISASYRVDSLKIQQRVGKLSDRQFKVRHAVSTT